MLNGELSGNATVTNGASATGDGNTAKAGGDTILAGGTSNADIILTDPAISPHHLVIRRTPDDRYELVSVADENGIRINRRQLDEAKINLYTNV